MHARVTIQGLVYTCKLQAKEAAAALFLSVLKARECQLWIIASLSGNLNQSCPRGWRCDLYSLQHTGLIGASLSPESVVETIR